MRFLFALTTAVAVAMATGGVAEAGKGRSSNSDSNGAVGFHHRQGAAVGVIGGWNSVHQACRSALAPIGLTGPFSRLLGLVTITKCVWPEETPFIAVRSAG